MNEANPQAIALAVSIIVPVYNEIAGLRATIQQLLGTIDAMGIPYEVLVVDDGSTDAGIATIALLPTLVLRHASNRGYGAALKTGLAHAQHPIVMIVDADGTYPIERAPDIIHAMSQYDMVVGARIGPGSYVPLLRRPVKWLLRQLASKLVGQPIPDLNSGLRAMRRAVVEEFVPVLPNGFSFTSTITLAMITNRYRVNYLPIAYHHRAGRSKFRPVRDSFKSIRQILQTVAHFQPQTRNGMIARWALRILPSSLQAVTTAPSVRS